VNAKPIYENGDYGVHEVIEVDLQHPEGEPGEFVLWLFDESASRSSIAHFVMYEQDRVCYDYHVKNGAKRISADVYLTPEEDEPDPQRVEDIPAERCKVLLDRIIRIAHNEQHEGRM
jgi:hypothetical protein